MALFDHLMVGRIHGEVGAPEMNVDNNIPHVVGHVLKRFVSKNTGIGNQEIDSPERVNGLLNHCFGVCFICDVSIICDRLATHRFYFVNHSVRHAAATTCAVATTP